jgi:hypothetical protein
MKRGKEYIQALRVLLLVLSCSMLTVPLMPQDTYRVMEWKTEHTLRTALLQQMHDRYDVRRKIFTTALESREALLEYRKLCRAEYIGLLGSLPEKTPLNASISGRLSLNGCVLEKIIIESRPGHHMTLSLYLPRGNGPFPAILFFCGHEMTSRATPSYQEAARLFAENGFAVMVTDPISQGERVQFTDDSGNRILRGSTTEHTLLNAGAILTGSSVAAWELFDNVRALDYLVSRDEIDSARIGCMGNSGGGVQTMYFISYDDRIKAAAPCSFITSREREYELNGTGDGCQQIPCEAETGLEIADYLLMFAPKPLLILAGKYDFVDYRGTVEVYRELESAYSVMGHQDEVALFTFDDGHGLSSPKREAALLWFRKWLCSDSSSVFSNVTDILDEKDIWCTPAGQLNELFSNEITVQEYNSRRVKELEAERQSFLLRNPREKVLDTLRTLLALNGLYSEGVVAEKREKINLSEYQAEKVILRKEDEVPLPVIILRPPGCPASDTLVLYLSHQGKSSLDEGNRQLERELEANRTVIAADLRGFGETAEKPQDNDPKYYNSEYHNAVLGMQLGQPLPGLRARDILILLGYIGNIDDLQTLPIKVIATGPAAPPALMAALFDSRIASLELFSTIRSFEEITDRPMEKEWFSYLIPGIMRYFDLHDLANIRPDLKIAYYDR